MNVEKLQGGPKKLARFVRIITLSNIDQFSNFFSLLQSRENLKSEKF